MGQRVLCPVGPLIFQRIHGTIWFIFSLPMCWVPQVYVLCAIVSFGQTEHLLWSANVWGTLFSPQVKELTKYLDPAGLGVIGFDDFCRGIAAIKNNGGKECVI